MKRDGERKNEIFSGASSKKYYENFGRRHSASSSVSSRGRFVSEIKQNRSDRAEAAAATTAPLSLRLPLISIDVPARRRHEKRDRGDTDAPKRAQANGLFYVNCLVSSA